MLKVIQAKFCTGIHQVHNQVCTMFVLCPMRAMYCIFGNLKYYIIDILIKLALKVLSQDNYLFVLLTKLYIPSALNIDLVLKMWHTQLIVCAVKR